MYVPGCTVIIPKTWSVLDMDCLEHLRRVELAQESQVHERFSKVIVWMLLNFSHE